MIGTGVVGAADTPPSLANGMIAFSTDRDGNRDVYVAAPDGSGQTRLTLDPSAETAPSWSRTTPNRIAFATDRDGNWEIYSLASDGTARQRLTSDPAADLDPAWSYDTRDPQLAFSSNRAGNSDIFVIGAEGEDPESNPAKDVTNDPAPQFDPAWSHDGAKIAYDEVETVRSSGGRTTRRFDVWTMNADGSGRVDLTRDFHGAFDPAWSPDDSQIAFTKRTGTNYDVWIMNADGSNAHALTSDSAEESHPAWSPDGKLMLYTSDSAGQYDIFVQPVDGSKPPANLTESGASDLDPAWQTVPPENAEVKSTPTHADIPKELLDRLCREPGVILRRKHGRIRGTPRDDTICGTKLNDKIYGFGGNDVIIDRGGADSIVGGAGDDTIFARDGYADTINGGPGNDNVQRDRDLDQVIKAEQVGGDR
jgi:Tol biopolymer transport system component